MFVLVNHSSVVSKNRVIGLEAMFSHPLRWYKLHTQRQQLSRLSLNQLEDIGLSTEQAKIEYEKPFWKS